MKPIKRKIKLSKKISKKQKKQKTVKFAKNKPVYKKQGMSRVEKDKILKDANKNAKLLLVNTKPTNEILNEDQNISLLDKIELITDYLITGNLDYTLKLSYEILNDYMVKSYKMTFSQLQKLQEKIDNIDSILNDDDYMDLLKLNSKQNIAKTKNLDYIFALLSKLNEEIIKFKKMGSTTAEIKMIVQQKKEEYQKVLKPEIRDSLISDMRALERVKAIKNYDKKTSGPVMTASSAVEMRDDRDVGVIESKGEEKKEEDINFVSLSTTVNIMNERDKVKIELYNPSKDKRKNIIKYFGGKIIIYTLYKRLLDYIWGANIKINLQNIADNFFGDVDEEGYYFYRKAKTYYRYYIRKDMMGEQDFLFLLSSFNPDKNYLPVINLLDAYYITIFDIYSKKTKRRVIADLTIKIIKTIINKINPEMIDKKTNQEIKNIWSTYFNLDYVFYENPKDYVVPETEEREGVIESKEDDVDEEEEEPRPLFEDIADIIAPPEAPPEAPPLLLEYIPEAPPATTVTETIADIVAPPEATTALAPMTNTDDLDLELGRQEEPTIAEAIAPGRPPRQPRTRSQTRDERRQDGPASRTRSQTRDTAPTASLLEEGQVSSSRREKARKEIKDRAKK